MSEEATTNRRSDQTFSASKTLVGEGNLRSGTQSREAHPYSLLGVARSAREEDRAALISLLLVDLVRSCSLLRFRCLFVSFHALFLLPTVHLRQRDAQIVKALAKYTAIHESLSRKGQSRVSLAQGTTVDARLLLCFACDVT